MLGALQGVMLVHPTTKLLLGMPGYIPMGHHHGSRSLDDNDYVEVMNIRLSYTGVLFDNLKAVVGYLGSCDKPKSFIGDVFKRMTASIELQALSHCGGSSTVAKRVGSFR
jgi:hypothetical protein